MGQSLQKLTPVGSEERKAKLVEKAQSCYAEFLSNVDPKDCNSADFYRAVCKVVEEINSELGNTQFKVPEKEVLEKAFMRHHQVKGKLREEEFQKILQDLITETRFTGIGAKDILFYIFGVPASTLLIKQGLMPRAIPNEIFIPVVTSATAFVLANLNKL